MTNPLRKFSEEQLLEELERRQRARLERDDKERPIPQCDECTHFDPNPSGETAVCKKGHNMSFRLPESYNASPSEWGFYRRVCNDRAPIPSEQRQEQNGV